MAYEAETSGEVPKKLKVRVVKKCSEREPHIARAVEEENKIQARLARVLKEESEGPLLQCDYQRLMKLRREGKVPRKPKGIKKAFTRDIRRKRAKHSDEFSSSDPGGEYAGVWPLEKREQSIRDPELPEIESTDMDDFFG